MNSHENRNKEIGNIVLFVIITIGSYFLAFYFRLLISGWRLATQPATSMTDKFLGYFIYDILLVGLFLGILNGFSQGLFVSTRQRIFVKWFIITISGFWIGFVLTGLISPFISLQLGYLPDWENLYNFLWLVPLVVYIHYSESFLLSVILSLVLGFLSGAIVGFCLGFSQSFIIEKRSVEKRSWVLYSMLGLGAPAAISSAVISAANYFQVQNNVKHAIGNIDLNIPLTSITFGLIYALLFMFMLNHLVTASSRKEPGQQSAAPVDGS